MAIEDHYILESMEEFALYSITMQVYNNDVVSLLSSLIANWKIIGINQTKMVLVDVVEDGKSEIVLLSLNSVCNGPL